MILPYHVLSVIECSSYVGSEILCHHIIVSLVAYTFVERGHAPINRVGPSYSHLLQVFLIHQDFQLVLHFLYLLSMWVSDHLYTLGFGDEDSNFFS